MDLDESVEKQVEFVRWLQDKGLYDQFDTAETMVKLQAVWEALKKERGEL